MTKVTPVCPNAAQHYPGAPDGYVERAEWKERLAQTHKCLRCSGCMLWVIWIPKTEKELAQDAS